MVITKWSPLLSCVVFTVFCYYNAFHFYSIIIERKNSPQLNHLIITFYLLEHDSGQLDRKRLFSFLAAVDILTNIPYVYILTAPPVT